MNSAVVLYRPEDLGSVEICAIAAGAQVEIASELDKRLASIRTEMLAALKVAHPVYGVTTGMGASSDLALNTEQQRAHQGRLMLARQVGTAPWFNVETVRAGLAARLRTFLNGDAGVSPALCHALVDFLNAGLTPAVPESSHGAAGEIIPLAHVGGALSGIGEVLVDTEAVPRASRKADEVLPGKGISPHTFGPKEGIAMLQGTPLAIGAALLLADEVGNHIRQHLLITATAVAMTGASRDPYDPALARGDLELQRVLEDLQRLLPSQSSRTASLQAPVSFRVTPSALAHTQRVTGQLKDAAERVLLGVNDSPAFVQGRFIGTATFDGFALAAGFDALRVAVLHLGELSAARLHRLLDSRFSNRPPQLSAEPGAQAGLVAVHKGAVGILHRILTEAAPSSLGLRETSLGQEDAQSFTLEAFSAAQRALDGVRRVLASELLALVHAERLEPAGAGQRATEDLVSFADEVVSPGVEDRPFGGDIAALTQLLKGRPS